MVKPSVTESDISRLEAERSSADRLYNDALTAVDRSLPEPPRLPAPVAPPDDSALARLRDLMRIVPDQPVPFTGWKARLGGFVWRLVAPIAQRQQEFNASLIAHLDGRRAHEGDVRAATQVLVDEIARHLSATARFQSSLIQYFQQVTLYVDTKDRHEVGRSRRDTEAQVLALAAGLDGLADEMLRRRESADVREQRFLTQVASVHAAHDEIRLSVASLQRGAAALARTLERLTTGLPAASHPGTPDQPAPTEAAGDVTPLATSLDAATYEGFEDSFRGTPETVRARLVDYLPLVESPGPVVDLGCGRGELLDLLHERGTSARGVDSNPAMVARCRARGLDVVEGDALAFLAAQPDDSLGAAVAIQLVEHLPPDRLVRLLEVAGHKLRQGGRIVLETVNPACWFAFFSSYIRDITHVRPIHPDTLRYLLVASGFQGVEIRYREPYPDAGKLQPVPAADLAGIAPELAGVADTINENVKTLNSLLFTHMDYAAIGQKP